MVDYTMTALGSTLARALMPLCERGTEHRARIAGIMVSRSPERGESESDLVDLERATTS